MLQVNNSGKGNCMYYAYGISLMYYLSAQKDKQIAERVFAKLNLDDNQKEQLRTLLSRASGVKYTTKEIKSIIEPILGIKLRVMAAEQTKANFKQKPTASPLFSAAQYGLEYAYKHILEEKKPSIAQLIDNDLSNKQFLAAEIFRIKGIDDAMIAFTRKTYTPVIDQFKAEWPKKEAELEAKKATKEEVLQAKRNVLYTILSNMTVAFFLENNEHYLNQYINHLKTEFVWGTEDTLLLLHNAIQGETIIRNEQGRVIDITYDIPIPLDIFRNNQPIYEQDASGMIINNRGNNHWTSSIPDRIFKFAGSDPKHTKDVQPEKDNTKSSVKPRKDKEKQELLIDEAMKKIESCMSDLDDKVVLIAQQHKAAEKLLAELQKARESYFVSLIQPGCDQGKAGKQFKEQCKAAIDKAKPVLEKGEVSNIDPTGLFKKLSDTVVNSVQLSQSHMIFTPAKASLTKKKGQEEQAEKGPKL